MIMQKFERKPQMSRLLADPYGLPINTPPLAMLIIKKYISERVRRIIKDRDLKYVFKYSTPEDKERFARYLCQGDTLQVKMLAAVYGASPMTLIDDLVSVFESTQTIRQFLALNRKTTYASRTLKKAELNEDHQWKWPMNMISTSLANRSEFTWDEFLTGCSADIARLLREVGWGKKILGVTYAHFTELILKVMCNLFDMTEEDSQRFFKGTLNTLPIPQGVGSNHHFSSTQEKWLPFLGASTATQLQRKIINPDAMSPNVTRVLELLDAYAFAKVQGSNFAAKVIQPLLACYTSIPMRNFVNFAPTKESG